MAARAAHGCGDQEDAESGGDAFAAFEPQPDGEHVSQHGEESGKALHVANGGFGSEMRAEQGPQPDGRAAFEHVQQKRRRAQALAAGAEHIGGADVAAADGANVLFAKDADQQVAHRDGAEQVRDHDDEQACKEHDDGEFNR